MSTFLLSKTEQDIVIFHVWKSLSYKTRLGLSVFMILVGFILQYFTFETFPGVLFVLAGNILLLVKGYDNRIKLDVYKPEAEWVKTDKEQLGKIVTLNRKAKNWDISAMDITNGLGFFVFILTFIGLLIIYFNGFYYLGYGLQIVFANILVLIYPHWFTGIKKITTTPKLLQKIYMYQNLMKSFNDTLEQDSVEYLMYVKGEDQKLPEDLKMKIKLKDQSDDFLGLYAQVSLNNVQGKDYPYFYVVLVARKQAGILSKHYDSITVPNNVIKEQSKEGEVEIIVIRQYTTKNSGYHTKANAINQIFNTGILAAREIVKAEVN